VSADPFWSLLIRTGICWSFLILADAYWYPLIRALVSADPCWALLTVLPAGFQRWKALMTREFTLIKRTIVLYKAKSFQIFVLGICAATLFLRTHVHPVSPNDGQEIAGFTFFGLLVIMVNGIAEMAMAVSLSLPYCTVVPP